MAMGRLLTGVYQACKWISHFAILHLLWVGCTLLGGIVFGIGPSTVAMYAVARKTIYEDVEISMVQTFWKSYRQEFLKANGLFFLVAAIGIIWYFDLQFFRQFEGIFYSIMNYLMIMVGLVYFILLLFLLPVYVHYDLKSFAYIKQALTIAFLNHKALLLLVVGGLSSYYFFITFPGFIPIFGITLFCHFNMWVAFHCFQSIEEFQT
ncbi:DUF624 domain-containing protein [Radiobacillus kanasensis]|uniref:YesL family protein n=1 Tax=Radiobacillus kanasensis TaxID=2844358 RepID=UPI001E4CDF5B|nr:DUF624 domain-containing protein [Radiobacillus kanasensis]UFT98752.1 DUF624 domain-containing protein [Radiobacillus kanasensis]